MDRPVTLIGIVLAILVLIFQLASILSAFVPILLVVAVILIGVGVVIGR